VLAQLVALEPVERPMIPTRMGDMMWRFDLRMILTGREAQREVVIQVEVGAMGC
jgi:hypothetical protein